MPGRIATPRTQRTLAGDQYCQRCGIRLRAEHGAYNATKAAVVALSETLAAELRPAGIQVSVALPAFFRTALLDTMRAPPREQETARLLMESSSYTAARAALDLLAEAASGRTYIMLPKSLRTVWRYKRWFPEWFLRGFPKLRARRLAPSQSSMVRS